MGVAYRPLTVTFRPVSSAGAQNFRAQLSSWWPGALLGWVSDGNGTYFKCRINIYRINELRPHFVHHLACRGCSSTST